MILTIAFSMMMSAQAHPVKARVEVKETYGRGNAYVVVRPTERASVLENILNGMTAVAAQPEVTSVVRGTDYYRARLTPADSAAMYESMDLPVRRSGNEMKIFRSADGVVWIKCSPDSCVVAIRYQNFKPVNGAGSGVYGNEKIQMAMMSSEDSRRLFQAFSEVSRVVKIERANIMSSDGRVKIACSASDCNITIIK